jgi:peroxiredoxin
MVLLESGELNYGEGISHFKLVDTRTGEQYCSSTELKKDIVVISFICNHCPYVVKIIEDFTKLAKNTQDFVDFVAISSNDPDYREEDSPENMKTFAKKHKFVFPYLFDETQEVAKNFGAVCTPDIFVYKKINEKYGLTYHARFEDLEKALNDFRQNDMTSFEQLPSAGCSIKWSS